MPNTPLHDGAVIVRGDRVIAAGCTLPLTDSQLQADLGMRHRGGTGITEGTDAIVVVVSEERGSIALAAQGRLRPNSTTARPASGYTACSRSAMGCARVTRPRRPFPAPPAPSGKTPDVGFEARRRTRRAVRSSSSPRCGAGPRGRCGVRRGCSPSRSCGDRALGVRHRGTRSLGHGHLAEPDSGDRSSTSRTSSPWRTTSAPSTCASRHPRTAGRACPPPTSKPPWTSRGSPHASSPCPCAAEVIGTRGVRILAVEPPTISVNLEQVVSRIIPVQPRLLGSPPSGFEIVQTVPERLTVEISGPESLVELAEHAVAEINVTGLTVGIQRVAELAARGPRGASGGRIRGLSIEPPRSASRWTCARAPYPRPCP